VSLTSVLAATFTSSSFTGRCWSCMLTRNFLVKQLCKSSHHLPATTSAVN
jgi:hypothetical protein